MTAHVKQKNTVKDREEKIQENLRGSWISRNRLNEKNKVKFVVKVRYGIIKFSTTATARKIEFIFLSTQAKTGWFDFLEL